MKSIWTTEGDSYPKRDDRVLVHWHPSKHRTSTPDICIGFYIAKHSVYCDPFTEDKDTEDDYIKEGWYEDSERGYTKLDNVVSWREIPV